MTMSIEQGLIMIVCAALGTVITRFLPFILFPDNKPTPEIVKYLGKVLPFSVIGLLVVYCLKNVSLLAFPFGLPELISIVIIVLLHVWKKNSLLSIAAGTIAYMALLQFVFV